MNQTASSTLSIGLAHKASTDLRKPMDGSLGPLVEELRFHQSLLDAQPPGAQQFFQEQGRGIAAALVQDQRQLQFALPDQVLVLASIGEPTGDNKLSVVPVEFRLQAVGGWIDRLTSRDLRTLLRQRLTQLEQSSYQAVATSARLVRYATVKYMVYDLLPAGEPVTYLTAEGDAIPSVPPVASDPAASLTHRYYLPQWVAFDDHRMLVDSVEEAEACFASMRHYVTTLHLAVSLAPYVYADEEYQRKHYGVLGQLVNQGRALAYYQTSVVIDKIRRYASEGKLNLGFSLSLPYFDDQALDMKMYDFEVIPPGRIMFLPSLVWRAARREQEKVQQDTRLNESTRIRLRAELEELARAFDTRPAATSRRG